MITKETIKKALKAKVVDPKIPTILFIIGPTASGKSSIAESIAQEEGGEIINADVGQLYSKLCIGTAKPDWKNSPIKHHLFDVLEKAENLSSFQYREMVLKIAGQIWTENKIPMVVGGSLFYIKSLFFPPADYASFSIDNQAKAAIAVAFGEDLQPRTLWSRLNEIDPVRAEQIHPNDIYRLNRAIGIWEKTGIKPSLLKPKFAPEFNSIIIHMNNPKEVLKKRIYSRTVEMIGAGWVEEARSLIGTEWEEFLKIKGLIGYKEIFEWISGGEKLKDKEDMIGKIQIGTCRYAKRQILFIREFLAEIKRKEGSLRITILAAT
jgi:tRNA dimethylallyltransferase